MEEDKLRKLKQLRESSGLRPPGKSGWVLDQGWLEYLALTYLDIDPEEFVRMKEEADERAVESPQETENGGKRKRRRKAVQTEAGFFWTTRPISLEVRIPRDARELAPHPISPEPDLEIQGIPTESDAEVQRVSSKPKQPKYTVDMFPEGTFPEVIRAVNAIEEAEEELRRPLGPGETLERP